MKNQMIADTLREYRRKRQLSIQDVALLLEEKRQPVSPKTIYSWEKGTTQPDIDTLFQLCSIYEIRDMKNAFGYSKAASVLPLSKEEEALVECYRQHPEMQEAVKKLLSIIE